MKLSIITSPAIAPDRGVNYRDQRVCLFVCLSVYPLAVYAQHTACGGIFVLTL